MNRIHFHSYGWLTFKSFAEEDIRKAVNEQFADRSDSERESLIAIVLHMQRDRVERGLTRT